MIDLIRLLRPSTSFLAAISSLATSFIVAGNNIFTLWLPALLGFVVVFLINAAGCALNDYIDRKTDKINNPKRPIPSGKVKPNDAKYLSAILFVSSIIIASLINQTCFLIALLAVIALLLYETKLKKIIAINNLSIGFLAGLTFVFGGFAVGMTSVIYLIAAIAFSATTAREITKDMADVRGDKLKITIPREFGLKNAVFISSFIYAIALIISPFPYLLGFFNWTYLPLVAIADLGFIYVIWMQKNNAKKAVKIAKLSMYLAILAFLAGAFVSI